MDLRDQIQMIALQWPCYGSRRITAELKARKSLLSKTIFEERG
jgi:hypothetical protein